MLANIQLALSALAPRERADASIAAEADLLEEVYGGEAIGRIRDKIAKAERNERARLYRIHDQLARRRADWAEWSPV